MKTSRKASIEGIGLGPVAEGKVCTTERFRTILDRSKNNKLLCIFPLVFVRREGDFCQGTKFLPHLVAFWSCLDVATAMLWDVAVAL